MRVFLSSQNIDPDPVHSFDNENNYKAIVE